MSLACYNGVAVGWGTPVVVGVGLGTCGQLLQHRIETLGQKSVGTMGQ